MRLRLPICRWKVTSARSGDLRVTLQPCAGFAGFAPGAIIVGSAAEAAAVAAEGPVALIAQTTIRAEEYAAIREALASRVSVLEVVDSICPATAERLSSLAELAKDCEALVVVGGHNSANTLRLKAMALDLGYRGMGGEVQQRLSLLGAELGQAGA